MIKDQNVEKKTSSNNKNKSSGDSGGKKSKKDLSLQTPEIKTPSGGGAIKGIDEKFQVNPNTGTLNFSIPLPFSEGRGLKPNLRLSYNSGAGNGIFGLGWNLNLPSIKRKTEKKLPQYTEDDTFVLSGVEDLVPVIPEQEGTGDYQTSQYRPRIESDFSRIERIIHPDKGTWWKVTSPQNVVTIFGRNESYRISDPSNPAKTFEWLPELRYDDKGNCIRFEYKDEDGTGYNQEVFDKNRFDSQGDPLFVNKYLKKIWYTNREPFFPDTADPSGIYDPALPESGGDQFLMEAIFDYGEHGDLPSDIEQGTVIVNRNGDTGESEWGKRKDAFSDYSAGFEIRTGRLCQRMLMYHHFDELDKVPSLVRSMDLSYKDWKRSENEGAGKKLEATYLESITERGYQYKGATENEYRYKSIPPMEFKYQELKWSDEVKEVPEEATENTPIGLSGNYQWTDLYNEGIPGILSEQKNAWYYKENLGNGEFTEAKEVIEKPSFNGLNDSTLQLRDLEADGRKQVVVNDESINGYFELTENESWESYTAFKQNLNIDLEDPNVRTLDLNGDGRPEIVITEQQAFTWYPSAGTDGYKPAEKAPKAFDEEEGPAIVFADSTQSIFLADMSGDGLTDIVRIRNGETCYWPNMGYGKFGAKVTMKDSPWFDNKDSFDPSLIELADISGTGTTDIIYLGKQKFKAWLNVSGNEWTNHCKIDPFPEINNAVDIRVTDFLGTGTSDIVWSSPLPGDQEAPLKYIDLMSGRKPHVMNEYKNNMGKEVKWHYRSSIHFYLQDKKKGEPWVTKLPFPVQVIEKVETFDHISRNRFVERYAYHHGFYDHVEKEFRGFGMVEQWDTESFKALRENKQTENADGDEEPGALNWKKDAFLPPVHTKTWFHTGAFEEAQILSKEFKNEYWTREEATDLLPSSIIPENLTAEEAREANRALKGSVLRKEVYAGNDEKSGIPPYKITQKNYGVKRLQKQGENKHAVFLKYPSETLVFNFERNAEDPRKKHILNLEVDNFGNVLKSVQVAYGRESSDDSLQEQSQTKFVYTDKKFTGSVAKKDTYRVPMPCENSKYELHGMSEPGDSIYSIGEFSDEIVNGGPEKFSYEGSPDGDDVQLRLVNRGRTLYLKDDLSGPAEFGTLGLYGLTYKKYRLALTSGQIEHIYGEDEINVTDKMLDEAGYVQLTDQVKWGDKTDENWWIPTGQIFYAPNGNTDELKHAQDNFFQPRRKEDPFGNKTKFTYDQYNLFLTETQDPVENKTTVGERDSDSVSGYDYRVLKPALITDPNGNRSVWEYDALGMVIARADMGKPGGEKGESLDEIESYLSADQLNQYLNAPKESGPELIGAATKRLVYDLFAYERTSDQKDPQAPFVWTLERQFHAHQDFELNQNNIQHNFSYSDGFDRTIQEKVIAAAPEDELDADPPHWLTSGWKVYNNKGNPVREYESFYSNNHRFEFERKEGVSPVIYYDALERPVATLHPDHTYEKTVFDAWQKTTWDRNDTVELDPRNDSNIAEFVKTYFELNFPDGDWKTWLDIKENEEDTSAVVKKTKPHADTPETAWFDSLGRPFLKRELNNSKHHDEKEEIFTKTILDIEGQELEVIDALDNTAMEYSYDVAGNRIHKTSPETGSRWMLKTIEGDPCYKWDNKNQRFRTVYDKLRRPAEKYLNDESGNKHQFEKRIYGEDEDDAEVNNLREQLYQIKDQAGILTHEAYDFKGNLVTEKREFAKDYKNVLDWSDEAVVNLEVESFKTVATFDALDRQIKQITPDDKKTRYTYNRAGLLKSVTVEIEGVTHGVEEIVYDAKGRRKKTTYKNGTQTSYEYDPKTFRLTDLKTRRSDEIESNESEQKTQHLSYTYDPAGNITRIENEQEEPDFFNGQIVHPNCSYTYDALYQLVEATGREHLGQNGNPESPKPFNYFHTGHHFNDEEKLGRYRRVYSYDNAGNIEEMNHVKENSPNESWKRTYRYEGQLSDNSGAEKTSNQLVKTTINGEDQNYGYNEHGCINSMSHLDEMEWDFRDRLRKTSVTHIKNGDEVPETTWYVYNYDGQRVRKVTEPQSSTENPFKKEERYYISNYEVYRDYKNSSSEIKLERETLHLMDDERCVAMIDTKTIDNNHDSSPESLIRYQLTDNLDSVKFEIDNQERIISYEEYFPFGGTSYQAIKTEVSPKRYRYTGMERDKESGLEYHSARYYLPWLARWLKPDPVGIKGGMNLYQYATNNPVRIIDPGGTDGWDVTFGVLKMVGGGFEAGVGVGLVIAGAGTSQFGVGLAMIGGGSAVALHGGDTMQAGFRQTFGIAVREDGEVDTITSHGLQAAGMERNTANLTDAGIGIVGSFGAGSMTAASKLNAVRASDPLAEGMSNWRLLNQIDRGSVALNADDYARLGGESTSALQKAEYIEEGVELTTTFTERMLMGIRLIPTGPTPAGNIGIGGIGSLAHIGESVGEYNQSDIANPENYETFEEFVETQEGPYSMDYLQERWEEVHGSPRENE